MAEPVLEPSLEGADIPALTSLRAVAAGLVLLHHYCPSSTGAWYVISQQGHVGVTVFFVLSGFLITVRYFRSWTERRLRLRDYFKKRAARILPLYYAVLLLALLLSGQPVEVFGPRWPEWTMTQGLFWDSLYYAIIPTSWSLTVEECFYALAPLLFFIVASTGGLRRRWTWTAILALTTVVLFCLGIGLMLASHGNHQFLASDRHLVVFTIFGRFFDFAAGMACAFLYLRGDIPRLWARLPSPHLAAALFLVVGCAFVWTLYRMQDAGFPWGSPFQNGWFYNFPIAILCALAIAVLTVPQAASTRFMALPPFVYLGKISYAVYLIQVAPLGLSALLQRPAAAPGVQFLVVYIGMSVASAILYEVIEKPSRRWLLSLGRD